MGAVIHAMLVFFIMAAMSGIIGFGELITHYSGIAKMLSVVFIMLWAFCIIVDLYLQLEKKS
jgi:uncharacterized membrane protein YtjA (UPF0391 family)